MRHTPSGSIQLTIACVLMAATVTAAQQARKDEDEATLRKAWLSVDDDALLGYLRRQGAADDDLAAIDQHLRDLGSSEYKTRVRAAERLVAVGPVVLPLLRKQVKEGTDPEAERNARRCITQITARYDYTAHRAAVRLLTRRTPAGTAAAFLQHLPYVVDEEVEADIWYALDAMARKGIDPAFGAALRDRFPARRAAAGFLLCRYGNEQQRRAARKRLADLDATVRLRVAQGLLGVKDSSGLPTLIALLEQPSVALAWQAEELLHYTAGKASPRETVGAGSPASRAACRKGWDEWWRLYGTKLDLQVRTGLPRMPGLVLMTNGCDAKSRIALSGCNGPHRWELNSKPMVMDVSLLAGDRLLIAQMRRDEFIPTTRDIKVTPGGVYECDLTGKVLWEHKGLPEPWACRRLPNGSTLVLDRTGLSVRTDKGVRYLSEGVVEITPEGRRVFQRHIPGVVGEQERLVYPFLLGNGRLFYRQDVDGYVGGIGEVDPRTGEGAGSVPHDGKLKRGVGIDPLGNGRYLLSLPLEDEVREVDAEGKTVWTYPCLVNEARRLRNGNTLISCWRDGGKVIEVTPDKRVVWNAVVTVGPYLRPCLPLVKLGFDGTEFKRGPADGLPGARLAPAATLTWKADAEDGSWNNKNNWTSSDGTVRVPQDDDVLVLQNATGTTTDDVPGLTKVNGLTINVGTQSVHFAQDLTINGAFTLTSGTVKGSGTLKLPHQTSSFTWSGGSVALTVTVGAAGVTGLPVTFNGGAKAFGSGGILDNFGTVRWTAGDIEARTGTILNEKDGVFDIRADANLTAQGFSLGTVTNNGVFKKTDGSGTSTLNVSFVNAGAGKLLLRAGTLKVPGQIRQTGAQALASLEGGNLTTADFILDGGTFQGVGALTGNLDNTGLQAGSTVAAGLVGLGQLNICGNYTQAKSNRATTQIDVGSTGDVSLLNVHAGAAGGGGTVTINGGLLSIIRDDTFRPFQRTTRTFVQGVTVAGTFQHIARRLPDKWVNSGNTLTWIPVIAGGNKYNIVVGEPPAPKVASSTTPTTTRYGTRGIQPSPTHSSPSPP